MRKHKEIFQNGILCMLGASFFFALMGGLAKFSLSQVSVTETVFFRSAVSALILAGVLFIRRQSYFGNRPWLLLGRGLAGFLALMTNFYAVSKLPLGDAAILNATSPLFVVFLSAAFLKERLTPKILLLTFLSFAGVALIVRPTFESVNLAVAAALTSGFLAALAYVAIRELHTTESFVTMAFYFTAVTTLLTAPLLIGHFVPPTPPVLLSLVGVGLCGTLGQLLMTYAYKNEKASLVSPFSYVAVLLSFVLGVLFFKEVPNGFTLFGSALVIVSCVALSQMKGDDAAKENSLLEG